MDHSHCESMTNILSFGCGCGAKRAAAKSSDSAPTVSRVTMYQVVKDSQVIEEFTLLPEARAKAVELGGRIKVASKVM